MSCCPASAWGRLEGEEGYVPQGKLEKKGDIDIYTVGSGEKCIIWNYDIFGLNAGRTKMLADMFADCGYLVLIPDWYRNGEGKAPTEPDVVEFLKSKTQWTSLATDWTEKVLPYAKSLGAKRFGAIGTCWGSYMVLRLSAEADFFGGVSWHPSHTPISGLLGESASELVKGIKCPQLVCPAGGDAKEDLNGEAHQQLVGEQMWQVEEFLEMKHGWTTRGDMKDEKVKRDVHKAIEDAIGFFKKHL